MPEMLVRMKRGKKTFEVMVNEGAVPKFREGKASMTDTVVAPVVFTNASKGTKASAEQLQAAFQTTSTSDVITEILQKGDAQESASERKDKTDAKRQEIISHLHKNYVSPNGRTIPVTRIENALKEIRARVDVGLSAARQVEVLAPQLMAVLPMKRAQASMEAVITTPAALSQAASAVIYKHAKVQRVVYAADVKFEVEVLAYDSLLKELANATNNDYSFVLAEKSGDPDISQANPEDGSGDVGNGKKKKKKKNSPDISHDPEDDSGNVGNGKKKKKKKNGKK